MRTERTENSCEFFEKRAELFQQKLSAIRREVSIEEEKQRVKDIRRKNKAFLSGTFYRGRYYPPK